MDRRTFLTTAALPALYPLRGFAQARRTDVSIRGDAFYINGRPTYAGRMFNGKRIEGLLMNIRVVQGIFDDLNPETASRWVYPDTKRWDPDRNTTRVHCGDAGVEASRRAGLHDQPAGGSPGFAGGRGRGRGAAPAGAAVPDAAGRGAPAGAPEGNAPTAPPEGGGRGAGRGPAGPQLENSAIDPDGNLRPAYIGRLERILDKADELGMVAIVGYFYFGQDQRLEG